MSREQSCSDSPANMNVFVEDQSSLNRNYEVDFAYVTKYSELILKSIGIWPASMESEKLFSRITVGLCNLMLFFVIVPFFLHIVLEQKDTVIMLKMIGFFTFCVTSLLKYWALTLRKPRIQQCIEQMKMDWKQVELRRNRSMMLKYGKMGRNLTILCFGFMYTGSGIYHTILQYAIGSFIDEHNRTIKPLTYPTYSALYDVQKIHVYVLVYTVHCICGYLICSVTTGACGLAAIFATHICGQIDIILARLSDLSDVKLTKRNAELNARFVEIVEHHLKTLRFSVMMEGVLQEVFFLELVGSTFMICLLEYYTIVDWKQGNTIGVTTYTMLLISLTFDIFILCYTGDLLIEKSTSIGTFSFEIDWYELPTKTIRGLILIIIMSSNPIKITAAGIVNLSLSTFVDVLKSSLGYLSFLRTVVV